MPLHLFPNFNPILMKKALLFLLAAGSLTSAFAQSSAPQSGSFLIYGEAAFSSVNDFNDDKVLKWNVTPGVGYQFNKNMTVGLNLGYGQFSKQAPGAPDPTVVTNYGVGAFFRYTYPLSNTFFLYGQFDGGYNGNFTETGAARSMEGNGYYATITPAVGVHIGRGYALNFAVGHIGYHVENMNPPAPVPSTSRSEFDVTLGQQMNIGISKNLKCRCNKASRDPMSGMRNIDTRND